jgi:hypothetical protein
MLSAPRQVRKHLPGRLDTATCKEVALPIPQIAYRRLARALRQPKEGLADAHCRSGANLKDLAQSWKNSPRAYHMLHVGGAVT